MVSAYILIQTEVGKAGQVTEHVRGIEGIVSVDPVTVRTTSSPAPTQRIWMCSRRGP
jgi:hypothetical protein